MKVVRFSLFSIAFLVVNQAFAISVDLSTWTDDTFLNTGGQSNWVVQNAPTNDKVEQTVNGSTLCGHNLTQLFNQASI